MASSTFSSNIMYKIGQRLLNKDSASDGNWNFVLEKN